MVGSPALLRLSRWIHRSTGGMPGSTVGSTVGSPGRSLSGAGASGGPGGGAFGSTRSLGGSLWSVGLLALACSSSQSSEAEWPPRVPASFRTGDPAPASAPAGPKAPAPSTAAPTERETAAQRGGAPTPLAERYRTSPSLAAFSGKATYYADSLAGNSTASGEPYDPKKHSAAHRKLPFGTVVRVTRQDTGAVTYVRVNDRGPFGSRERIIDLSRAAAEELEMLRAGVVPVRVEVVARPE